MGSLPEAAKGSPCASGMSSQASPPVLSESSPHTSTHPTTNRVACERCWRRKQRCDRLLPTCSQCTEAKAVCEQRLAVIPASEGPGGRPGSEISVPTGQGYIGTLKRRIEHLEGLARGKRIRTGNADGGIHDSPRTSQPQEHTEPLSLQDSHELGDATIMRRARGEFDHLVLSSLAADSSDTTSPANKLSLVHMIRSTLSTTATTSTQKPEIDAGDLLIDRYVCHVLHRYPYMSSIDIKRVWASFRTGEFSPEDAFLIYMALATVDKGTLASQCYAYATTTLLNDVVGSTGTPVTIMRSLVSMVLCSLYHTKMGSYWPLLGIAISKAISLGLHRLDTSSTNDHREYQRLFWILFILDRQASSAYCQPMALKAQDVVTPVLSQDQLSNSRGDRDAIVLPELVEHAQILSLFRQRHPMSTLYFSSIVSYWRDGNNLVNSEASPADRQLFAWLDIQLMLVLNQYVQDHRQEAVQQSVLGFEEEIVEQTVRTAHAWLEAYMERLDDGVAMPCAIDPLLIATASITCERIQKESISGQDTELEQLCKEVQILSLSLLSSLSERFTQAKDLRKALMLLDRTRALRRKSSGGPPDSATQSLHEWEHNKSIPRGLRKMLLQALTT